MAMSASQSRPWRKILYEQQPYPDSYTDATFLDEMRKNINTKLYDFRTIVHESGIVSQQLCTICIFVSTFVYMDRDNVSPSSILLVSAVITCFAALLMKRLKGLSVVVSGSGLVALMVFGVSPILKTLTITISTDTIYAMTTGLLLANMLFHDYGAQVAIVSKAVSLNTSIFAAVCLASRLPTSWHAYVTVILAIQLFALFPELRRACNSLHPKGQIIMTEGLLVTATVILLPISVPCTACLFMCHLLITFFFPFWMMHLQKLKSNIHGPWDEAIIVK